MIPIALADIEMVEAAGIEPASENIATWTSTSLSLILASLSRLVRAPSLKAIPLKFPLPCQQEKYGRVSC